MLLAIKKKVTKGQAVDKAKGRSFNMGACER